MLEKFSKRILSIERSPLYSIMDIAKSFKDVIFLNIGEPDFETPKHIIEAGKRALDQGYTKYASAGDRGDFDLRVAISDELKRETGINYDPNSEILVTAGSQAALYCAIMATVNPDEEVIIISPYYPPYLVDIKLAGGKPVIVNANEESFIPDPKEVEEKVTERTKGIIIHTPNNPTGVVYTKDYLEKIADIARRYDLLVYSDEVYSRIVYNGVKHVSIASLHGMRERTIVINSASKPYAMTGWRVGYLAAPETFVSQFLKLHHSINICANPAAQRAFLAALLAPQDCVNEFIKEFDERRKFIVEALNSIPGVSCKKPYGAFYVFPNVKSLKLTSLKLAEYLVKEARVVIVPGIGFGFEGYVRISYAAPIKILEEAIRRIKSAIEKLR